MEGWEDRRVSMIGGGWGREGVLPPLEIGKKMLSEEILTSFTYVLLGGDRYTIHAKWKGVGRQAFVHGGRGPCPPPPRKGKKETIRGNFNLFHLCFTNEVKGGSIHYTCKMEEVGGQALVHGGRGQ